MPMFSLFPVSDTTCVRENVLGTKNQGHLVRNSLLLERSPASIAFFDLLLKATPVSNPHYFSEWSCAQCVSSKLRVRVRTGQKNHNPLDQILTDDPTRHHG